LAKGRETGTGVGARRSKKPSYSSMARF